MLQLSPKSASGIAERFCDLTPAETQLAPGPSPGQSQIMFEAEAMQILKSVTMSVMEYTYRSLSVATLDGT